MNLKQNIRLTARNLFLDTAGMFRRPAYGVHILGGHKITKEPGHGSQVDIDRFDRQLSYLSKYCRLVRFEDALKMIDERISPDIPVVAFSFDDGFEDCYFGIAPVLEKYGINGMFFINPSAADAADVNDKKYIIGFADSATASPGKRPMNWAQIQELQNKGHQIGAHTLDHYMVNQHDEAELRHQIVDCRPRIENRLQTECNCFAWPYGRMSHINDKALDYACGAYDHVFSQTDYKNYYSCNGRVINRRHFEPFWDIRHTYFFLSFKKKY